MERDMAPEMIVALYASLADAEAALDELQEVDVPYPDIRLAAHAASDPDRPALEATALPEHFWSLSVWLYEPGREQAVEEVLGRHQPLAIGQQAAPNKGRKSADRGAIAWRHYIFEAPESTSDVTDAAGTTGTTGIVSSGVFATGARAEGNPPARGVPAGDKRPAAADQPPTTDDRGQETAVEGHSRPTTELKG